MADPTPDQPLLPANDFTPPVSDAAIEARDEWDNLPEPTLAPVKKPDEWAAFNPQPDEWAAFNPQPRPRDEWDNLPDPTQASPAQIKQVPQAFLQRLAIGRDVGDTYDRAARAMKAFDEGFGDRPLGLTPWAEEQLRDAGIISDSATGRGGALRLANEAAIRPAAALVDLLMRTVSGTASWVAESRPVFSM